MSMKLVASPGSGHRGARMKWLAGLTLSSLVLGWSALAEARDPDDCKRAWSQAVRSYLTQKRNAGPDGKAPASLDEQELVLQAWMATFEAACQMEAQGDKEGARLEAALAGVQALARLDQTGCARFMEFYMGSQRGGDVCSAAGSANSATLKEQIRSSIPAKTK